MLLMSIKCQFLKTNHIAKKKTLKYFIGYKENDVIRPLCLRLSQMTGYIKKFTENIIKCLRVKDEQLLKNYNKKWKKN